MFTEEEILAEVQKIQYLYGLKREIRYAEKRADKTESVAEHIYGMHICALYFLELENPDHTWNRERIFEMITVHDFDELETGDMIGYLKTASDRENEVTAMGVVLGKIPDVMKRSIEVASTEYQLQNTIESRFVKAIDKIEAQIHTFCDEGKKMSLLNHCEEKAIRTMREPHIIEFLKMHPFFTTVHTKMIEQDYFAQST